jgi:hypothetical protein
MTLRAAWFHGASNEDAMKLGKVMVLQNGLPMSKNY